MDKRKNYSYLLGKLTELDIFSMMLHVTTPIKIKNIVYEKGELHFDVSETTNFFYDVDGDRYIDIAFSDYCIIFEDREFIIDTGDFRLTEYEKRCIDAWIKCRFKLISIEKYMDIIKKR